MAPAESDAGSSSGCDIPYKENEEDTKTDANGAAEEDEDDEEGEEYAVEKILSHKFEKNGKLIYKVKWVGYDETTMEPEENLDGCPAEMKTYFKLNGGKPIFDGKPGKGTPASTKQSSIPAQGSGYSASAKRRLSANDSNASPTPTQGGRGRKKVKTDADDKDDGRVVVQEADGKKTFKAPLGSWEKDIVGVDTVERDSKDGTLYAYIVWNHGMKSRHPTKVLNTKCSGRMLAFYEAHIVFNSPDAGKHVVSGSGSTNAAAPSPPTRSGGDDDLDDDDDEEMIDVKPVATSK